MAADQLRATAADVATATLSPLLQSYEDGVAAVLSTQRDVRARLEGLLADLAAAQAAATASPHIAAYAARVEALRKRLDAVAATMGRVQGRLDGLQAAITKVETR